MAELWPVFLHEIVEERLDFGWLAANLEECGLQFFFLLMMVGGVWLGGIGGGRGGIPRKKRLIVWA